MNKYVKTSLYWLSLVCPIVDICKGVISGIYKSIVNAEEEYKQIKQAKTEELIAHKSILNKQRFDKDNEL